MDLLAKSFVGEVREPVRLVNVAPGSEQNPARHEFSTLQQLRARYDDAENEKYSCRFISICQRTSFGQLQITRPMLDLIVSRENVHPSFWDLPSCFYKRRLELEEAFCVPFTQVVHGPWTDISYTIRYPELKEGEQGLEWVIRQSGIYQRFNSETRQNLIVLLSPTPNSKAHRIAEDWLLSRPREATESPFRLHKILFSAYLPAWRQYTAAKEEEALTISNTTFATYIEEQKLRVGYNHLSTLVGLEKCFLKAHTVLHSTADVLDGLVSLSKDPHAGPEAFHLADQFKNYHRQSDSYARTAGYLQQRAKTTAKLLADTLALHDQVIANHQNGNMLQLNKSAVFITILTLVYLPASFSATLFGMNFFDMDQEKNRIVYTPMIWIYVVLTAVLSGITFLFYYWLVRGDGHLFQRVAPNVRIADWRKTLMRRVTKTDTAFELHSQAV